jgi:hypothetical protein
MSFDLSAARQQTDTFFLISSLRRIASPLPAHRSPGARGRCCSNPPAWRGAEVGVASSALRTVPIRVAGPAMAIVWSGAKGAAARRWRSLIRQVIARIRKAGTRRR